MKAHESDQRRPCIWCGSVRSQKRYKGGQDPEGGGYRSTSDVECVDDYGCFRRQDAKETNR